LSSSIPDETTILFARIILDMPNGARTILAGTNLGVEFANIAYAASSVIHSDASGDIDFNAFTAAELARYICI
jgi:hypothetical protein